MTLQDFFVSGLPSGNTETKPKIEEVITTDEIKPKPERQVSTATTKTTASAAKRIFIFSSKESFYSLILAAPATPPADTDVETRLKVSVKNPEIILLEDQHNINSNCLVLDVSFSNFFHFILQSKESFS